MYPGQIAMSAAATMPAPESQTSLAKKYATRVVLEAKKGAVRTQTSRMCTKRRRKRRREWMAAAVSMRPG